MLNWNNIYVQKEKNNVLIHRSGSSECKKMNILMHKSSESAPDKLKTIHGSIQVLQTNNPVSHLLDKLFLFCRLSKLIKQNITNEGTMLIFPSLLYDRVE